MGADLFPRLRVSDVKEQHKIDELKRELEMRKRVYPRLVERGKLKPDIAEMRITILRAVLRDYIN